MGRGVLVFLVFLLLVLPIASADIGLLESLSTTDSRGEKIDVYISIQNNEGISRQVSNQITTEKLIDVLDVSNEQVLKSINTIYGSFTQEQIDVLKKDPSIKISKPMDIEIRRFLSESTDIIGAVDTRNIVVNSQNITGKHQTVCIIDDGIDVDHPDLSNRILYTYDFVENTTTINFKERHGTHVAGIVGASGGINGTAPEVGLIGLDVFSGSNGTNDILINRAIDWCITNAQDYNISVISMSLGGNKFNNTCDNYIPTTTSLINAANSNNISVVIATSNANATQNASAGIAFPACISGAIRVGASSKADAITSYSFRNVNFSDILLAPGGTGQGPCTPSGTHNGICSTDVGGGYYSIVGTSMATPHVSGVIALLQQYNFNYGLPMLTPAEIFEVLNSTGVSLYDSETDKNYTRIDAFSAIEALSDNIELDLYLSVSNLTINDNITIIWNSSGSIETIWLNISNKDFDMVFNSTNLSGIVTLGYPILNLSGSYNITFYAENNFENKIRNATFELLKITPDIGLLLNGNNTNISVIAENVSVNIFTNESPSSDFDLFINNEFNLSNSSINVTYLFEELGVYNITVVHNESEFYNAVYESLFVNLTGFPITLEINSSVSALDFSENITIIWNASGSIDTIWFNITDPDETVIFSSENISGGVFLDINNLTIDGVYNITLFAENNLKTNISSASFNVSKIVPNVTLLMNGSFSNLTLFERGDVNITAFENSSYELDLLINNTLTETNNYIEQVILFELGSYNITARFNENVTHLGVQETLFLDVVLANPNITFSSDLNVSIYENQTVLLDPVIVDPFNRSLSYEWYFDDVLLVDENSTNYLFNGSSEGVGNYNVTLIVIANETRNSSISWNITVDYVPPSVFNIVPSQGSVVIKQNNSLVMSVDATNFYNETNLSYEWFVDEVLVEDNSSSYEFNTSKSFGVYNVSLVVNNSFAVSVVNWTVEVVDNRPPEFIGPNIANRVIIQGETVVLVNNLNDLFFDPDGDLIEYRLERVSGTSDIVLSSTGPDLTVFAQNLGQRNYTIVAEDTDGATASSNVFEIDVRPVTSAPSAPGGADGGAAAMPAAASSATDDVKDDEDDSEEDDSVTSRIASSVEEDEDVVVFNPVVRSSNEDVVLTQRVIENVSIPPPARVYKILEINSSDNVELEIEFDVEKSWLAENNLDAVDVALYKLEGDDWVMLRTEVVREGSDYFSYVAITPGFSIFAIGERIIDESSSNWSTWLFNILSAIFAIVAILLTIVLVEKYAKKHAVKTVKKFEDQQEGLVDQVNNYKKDVERHIKENNLSEAKKSYNDLKEIYDHSITLSEEERKELGKQLLDYYNQITKK
ncbi:MAG: S8 family serine peptidase [Candidatus Woesearchaeota archaeon]